MTPIGPLTNFWFALSSGVLFLCRAKLYRSCPIRDKGLYIVKDFDGQQAWKLTTGEQKEEQYYGCFTVLLVPTELFHILW